MSKPDPAGGSLESILASIRKSLTEQSPDALSETAAAPSDQDKDAKLPRKGLTQRLAGASAEAPSGNPAPAADDLSDLLEGPADNAVSAPKAAPAPDVTSPVAAPAAAGEQDPLWFLTRRDEPAPEAGSPPPAAATEPQNVSAATPSAEPKLTRPEVLRASMPPFFGSSAEAAKPASTPAESAAQAPTCPHVTRPQSAAQAAPAAQPGGEAAIAREVSLVAAAAEAAAARPRQTAPQPVLNGKGPVMPEPSAANAILAGDTPQNRALEVMVLDLLKPMLSQWLDQNMPRLVAEALSEEVQRTRGAKGDVKKT
jgi:cell pole-organizing protein PopZ